MTSGQTQHKRRASARWAPLADLVAERQHAQVSEVANRSPSNPLVSVVVTTYRHAQFIAQCLDSILAQRCDADFEILVGEDESADQTRDICLDYAARFPGRIRLFLHNPANKIRICGITTGRFNLAYLVSQARGDFICLCEGDDYWRDPEKIGKQLALLRQRPDCVLAFADSLIVEEGRESDRHKVPPAFRRDLSALELALPAFVPTQTIMFRNVVRSQPIPDAFFAVLNADTYLLSYLSRFGGAAYASDVTPCAYRIHPGGLWSPIAEAAKAAHSLHTTRAMRRLHADPAVLRAIDDRLFRQLRHIVRLAFASRAPWEATVGIARILAHVARAPSTSRLILEGLRNRMSRRSPARMELPVDADPTAHDE